MISLIQLLQLKILAVAQLKRLRRPTRRELVWVLAGVPALFLLYVLALIPFTPGISDIRKARFEQPAQVLSSDGQLLTEFKRVNRAWVPLKQVAPSVLTALIATEDHRFYQHFGLDWRRTASAALSTFSGNRQGGSTLTQQLARNLYPQEVGRAPTLTRKLKEAITAFKIELLYTKDEILETYLNTVPSDASNTDGTSDLTLRRSPTLGVKGISSNTYSSTSTGSTAAARHGWALTQTLMNV